MYKNNKICVVVPAYNEEKFLLHVIKTMPEFIDHIVVLDDASTDKTFEIASTSGDARVFVIKHEVNHGVGGAIISGHKKALEYGADISVVMAGDGQMDPQYLPDLLDPIIEDGYHYTKGNRFLKKSHYSGCMPKKRIFGNFVLTFMTKLASGYWNIFDPQNGYTAIKRECLETMSLDELQRGYQFENDMLFHLNLFDFRVKDIAIPSFYGEEISDIKLYKFIPTTIIFLIKTFFKRIFIKYMLYDFNPIALFYLSGFLLILIGIIFGIYAVYVGFGPIMPSSGSVMLSVFPFSLGFQLFLAAMVLDIIATPK